MITPAGSRRPPACGEWLVWQLIYENALSHLDTVFASIGTRYMPIKGAYLLCAGLAPLIPARVMVDIDLLVLPEDFRPTVDRLGEHPLFTRCAPDPWHFEQAFLFANGAHTIKIELHCQLNREERFRLPAGGLFARGVAKTAVCMLPSAEDALVIFLCHTLVHSGFGFPASTGREIEVLIGQKGFSWERCRELIGQTGIEPYCFALLRHFARAACIAPATLSSRHRWADLFFRTVPVRDRFTRLQQVLYRGFVGPFFARSPVKLMAGWAWRRLTRGRRKGRACPIGRSPQESALISGPR